ncbi:MAG: ADP-ribosylglycohydrolase family protein [Bacteroidia bacterium]|nr:ADP-ribosylglycohydrolase family protein [Bacteroidia bacterium]
MKAKFKSTSSIVFLFLCLFFLSNLLPSALYAQGTDNAIQYRQLPMDVYKDKVAGGWLGQAIAVLWGQWTEGKWQTSIVPFDLEDWYRAKTPPKEISDKAAAMDDRLKRREFMLQYYGDKKNWEIWVPDKMSDQDDLYIEFMFLHSILKNGLDVTATEIAEDWVKYLAPNRIWGANKASYLNFQKGIWPPMSGNPRYTPQGDAIDYQIEADLFGLISPGLPRISNAWGDKVGHIMNYGDGVYGGMAMSAMYAAAFFESDPRKLAEYSLKAIPSESGYAKMVQDMLDVSQKYPNWQDAWKVIKQKWGMKDGKPVPGLDVRINGAFVYMGLLYGGGDFWKSMNISMRCGVDSDCNPSSVAGILGTVMGMKKIPEKWAILRNLPIDNIAIKDIFPNPIKWDDILDATVEVGKWNILQNGGYLSEGVFFIPYQTPTSAPLEQTIWVEQSK